MVLSIITIITVAILLLSCIVFFIGFLIGHIKSIKKYEITINFVNFEEEDNPEDYDVEVIPDNVTPIKRKDATNDGLKTTDTSGGSS